MKPNEFEFHFIGVLKSQQKRVERDQKTAFAEKYERQRAERFRQRVLGEEGSAAFRTRRLLALSAGGRVERRRLGTPASVQLAGAGLVDLTGPMGAHHRIR
jgi:hypothetical protein